MGSIKGEERNTRVRGYTVLCRGEGGGLRDANGGKWGWCDAVQYSLLYNRRDKKSSRIDREERDGMGRMGLFD